MRVIRMLIPVLTILLGVVWKFPAETLDLARRALTALDLQDTYGAIAAWAAVHPNMGAEFGPWYLIGLGTLSLLASSAWPPVRRFASPYFAPMQLFLMNDIETGKPGIQTFPGVIYIQACVDARMPLTECRAWVESIEYRAPEEAEFTPELSEILHCQWSGHGGDHPHVAALNESTHLKFNVATIHPAHKNLQTTPTMPTRLSPLLQRKGTHRFVLHVVGNHKGDHKSLTEYLDIDWNPDDGSCDVSLFEQQ